MPKRSAGLLLYRWREARLEVFLIHPGGPFWAKKDDGAWSIPKGEYVDPEDPLAAACREFSEETGFTPDGDPTPLGDVRQSGGKLVSAWALEGDCDPEAVVSNEFSMEWPPRSGKMRNFPEADRAAWFSLAAAQTKLLPAQLPFLQRLAEKLTTK